MPIVLSDQDHSLHWSKLAHTITTYYTRRVQQLRFKFCLLCYAELIFKVFKCMTPTHGTTCTCSSQYSLSKTKGPLRQSYSLARTSCHSGSVGCKTGIEQTLNGKLQLGSERGPSLFHETEQNRIWVWVWVSFLECQRFYQEVR